MNNARVLSVAGCLALCGPIISARAADATLTVKGVATPGLVWCQPQTPLKKQATYLLKRDGRSLVAQVDDDGRLWWNQPEACDSDRGCIYMLAAAGAGEVGGVKVTRAADDSTIEVTIDGRPFTTFNYGKDLPKPFLYPVHGPTGEAVTRSYPMKTVDAEPKNRRDHPHHRSIWTALGDVRTSDFTKPGVDYWAQDADTRKPTKGIEKVTRIVQAQGGPVFGIIQADIDWVQPGGKKDLSETRTYRFYKTGDDQRVIDVRVAFRFTEGDVMFADTKEGGIISLRLAISMDEVSGGRMVNSQGQAGMRDCWGMAANWCDYVGPVAGKTLGVAVFDSPANFSHPTRWHIRDYGLYTANPFMAGAVTTEQHKKDATIKVLDGAHTWKKGETAVFDYRVLIHTGDTKDAKIAEQYEMYVKPAEAVAQ